MVCATNGDLRLALNGLELAVKSTAPSEDGKVYITLLTVAREQCKCKALTADKDGDVIMMSSQLCRSRSVVVDTDGRCTIWPV